MTQDEIIQYGRAVKLVLEDMTFQRLTNEYEADIHRTWEAETSTKGREELWLQLYGFREFRQRMQNLIEQGEEAVQQATRDAKRPDQSTLSRDERRLNVLA